MEKITALINDFMKGLMNFPKNIEKMESLFQLMEDIKNNKVTLEGSGMSNVSVGNILKYQYGDDYEYKPNDSDNNNTQQYSNQYSGQYSGQYNNQNDQYKTQYKEEEKEKENDPEDLDGSWPYGKVYNGDTVCSQGSVDYPANYLAETQSFAADYTKMNKYGVRYRDMPKALEGTDKVLTFGQSNGELCWLTRNHYRKDDDERKSATSLYKVLLANKRINGGINTLVVTNLKVQDEQKF